MIMNFILGVVLGLSVVFLIHWIERRERKKNIATTAEFLRKLFADEAKRAEKMVDGLESYIKDQDQRGDQIGTNEQTKESN